MQKINELPEKPQKKTTRHSFMGILKKGRRGSTNQELEADFSIEDYDEDEKENGYSSESDDGRPDSVDDKVRKNKMRKGIDLATTLERIEKNFVITDPRLPDNPIIFASDSFLELTEYSREEILGRNCSTPLRDIERSIGNMYMRRSCVKPQRIDDYDCTVCLKLLYEPITTSCGHSFCRSCFFQSMDRGNCCPLCRTVLFISPTTCSISITLNNIIQKNFSEEYEERKSEHDSLTNLGVDLLPLFAIFKSPKAMRGGISICFPQFWNCISVEQQGFARNKLWTIENDPPPLHPNDSLGKSFVDLLLKPAEEDLKCWSHGFEFYLRVSSDGNLILISRIRNINWKSFGWKKYGTSLAGVMKGKHK